VLNRLRADCLGVQSDCLTRLDGAVASVLVLPIHPACPPVMPGQVLKKLRRLPWAESEPYLLKTLVRASYKGRFSQVRWALRDMLGSHAGCCAAQHAQQPCWVVCMACPGRRYWLLC